jgi:membrane associated rhomboid family serine protease
MTKYPATVFVLLTCIALQCICTALPQARDFLAFTGGSWMSLFQAITYQFAHANWAHLIGNFMVGLPFMLYLESRLGKQRFLEFYLLCGMMSLMVHLVVMGGMWSLIGASGSIFGVIVGACLAFGETRKDHLLALGFISVITVEQLGLAASSFSTTAFYGHLGGILCALLLSHTLYFASPRRATPPAAPKSK